jgi:hypothetical protein
MTKQFGVVIRDEVPDITWQRLPAVMLLALVKISEAEKRSNELRRWISAKQDRRPSPCERRRAVCLHRYDTGPPNIGS